MLKIIARKIWEDSYPLRMSLLITSLVLFIPWLVVVIFKEKSVWFGYLLIFLMIFIVVARIVIYVGELRDEVKRHLTKREPDECNVTAGSGIGE